MASIIKVEALSGVQDDGPLCYLLQVDQVFILLDCGWDDRFDLAYIDAIKLRVPQINAVLISYADMPHIGALPYLVGKCDLNCPIYATVPVYKMGQLFLYDWLAGHNTVEDFTLFDYDDIDAAFEKVQQVKYSQTILLKGDNGLQITPFPAGHMIGGAVWRITKMGEEEIVYAVDFNHKKERHLNGCTFDGIGRPNLLITDAFSAIYNQQKRKQRDENLVSKLLSTVRDGGDAMVVIDTAGRVLEIAHLLDQLWQNKEAGLITYNLVMLSNVASSVIESAKSQVEWMSDKVLRIFEAGRHNPFQFRYVKFCHSLNDLNRVRSPKVVLVSGLEMESGCSRELFLEWCSDTKNMVIVTGRTGERTLGSKLIRIAESRERKRPVNNAISLEIKRRIRLEGQELEAYRNQKKQNEKEEARQRLETVRRNARLEHAESSDDSDDDEAVAAAAAAMAIGKNKRGKAQGQNGTNSSAANGPVYGGASNGTETTRVEQCYDIMRRFEHHQRVSFFKQSKKQFPMFPYQEEKSRWDDYGEIIRPDEYLVNDSAVSQLEKNGSTLSSRTKSNSGGIVVKGEEDDADGDDFVVAAAAAAKIIEEWPTKCISYVSKVEILCKVEFIEFEGRSDGESIKKILAQIKPKQLVVVHGSPAATRHLAEYCTKNNIVQGKIFTPTLGEVIDATIESHIFQVTLSDQLMCSLSFQTVKDAELSWIDARLLRKKTLIGDTTGDQTMDVIALDENEVMESEVSANIDTTATSEHVGDATIASYAKTQFLLQTTDGKMNTNDIEDIVDGADETRQSAEETRHSAVGGTVARLPNVPIPDQLLLEALPSSCIPSHQSVFVNDPKLTDLKQLLAQSGFHAEFNSGVLYVNNVASVRRNDAGRFNVEGFACEDYFRIRDIIYAQFAIV